MSELERYTVTMPRELFVAFDERNRRKGYKNRSEAIRDLVRAALIQEEWGEPDKQVAATITFVYDHHARELSDKINRVQHRFGELVVSALHVHLEHNCLEVVVTRGKAGEIHQLADALGSIRGVKHTQLALTTQGKELK